jgi:hypothetical protein
MRGLRLPRFAGAQYHQAALLQRQAEHFCGGELAVIRSTRVQLQIRQEWLLRPEGGVHRKMVQVVIRNPGLEVRLSHQDIAHHFMAARIELSQ